MNILDKQEEKESSSKRGAYYYVLIEKYEAFCVKASDFFIIVRLLFKFFSTFVPNIRQ